MISNYELQYMNLVRNIMDIGYYDNNRTGMSTKKLPHQSITVDLQREFPILKTKQVFFKTAVKEILWIMQKQSNNINDLGGHIWDEWADENGSIGKAYGYQVKQYHQIDNLIKTLKTNPQDRRMMINLWNWKDLPEMNLAPCCFLSMWDVNDGKLNCMLIQRSGDVGLGVPFNTTQYAVLTHLIAQATGLKVGMLTHIINNAHIYENHFDAMNEQLDRYDKLVHSVYNYDTFKDLHNYITHEDYNKIQDICSTNPKLKPDSNIKDFYKFTIDDIILEDYQHMGKIEMEVSV
jgi:thymidylate synthase